MGMLDVRVLRFPFLTFSYIFYDASAINSNNIYSKLSKIPDSIDVI